MLEALMNAWNWIKSLFSSCLPTRHPQLEIDQHETDPLLVSESDQNDDLAEDAQHPVRSTSAALMISLMHRLPAATLTTQEFCDVMADAYEGSTRTLDAMHNAGKQEIGYQLIHRFAMQYVAEIDRDIDALRAANPHAYNVQNSWGNMRASVVTGNMAEYGIAYICDEFSKKHLPKDDFNAAVQQHDWLENIKTCFGLCKKLMTAYRKFTITKEREDEAKRASQVKTFDPIREETRMNAKTLKLVNDFNKRCEESAREEEALAASGHTYRRRVHSGRNRY